MDSRSPALGAKVVARAWVDPAFKKRLLADTRAALAELGIDIGTLAEFRTVENTAKVHNVIVCTLCSCYPKMLLGIPPAWYKSLAYRSRTVVDPRGVLAEFGIELPEGRGGARARFHRRPALLVLPMRPKGTRGLERGAARRPRDPRLHDRHRRSRSACPRRGRGRAEAVPIAKSIRSRRALERTSRSEGHEESL